MTDPLKKLLTLEGKLAVNRQVSDLSAEIAERTLRADSLRLLSCAIDLLPLSWHFEADHKGPPFWFFVRGLRTYPRIDGRTGIGRCDHFWPVELLADRDAAEAKRAPLGTLAEARTDICPSCGLVALTVGSFSHHPVVGNPSQRNELAAWLLCPAEPMLTLIGWTMEPPDFRPFPPERPRYGSI